MRTRSSSRRPEVASDPKLYHNHTAHFRDHRMNQASFTDVQEEKAVVIHYNDCEGEAENSYKMLIFPNFIATHCAVIKQYFA
jgi:glucuronate isomerase